MRSALNPPTLSQRSAEQNSRSHFEGANENRKDFGRDVARLSCENQSCVKKLMKEVAGLGLINFVSFVASVMCLEKLLHSSRGHHSLSHPFPPAGND